MLDIDVKGALKFVKVFKESIVVAIIPPSVESLRKRLNSRGTDSQKSIETRLENATGEIEEIFKRTDVFRYRIVNEDLQLAGLTMTNLLLHVYYKELYAGKKKSSVLPCRFLQDEMWWNPELYFQSKTYGCRFTSISGGWSERMSMYFLSDFISQVQPDFFFSYCCELEAKII